MLCHQVYPIPSTSTATGVSITVVVRQMGRKEPRSPTEQGRLPPSRLKSPRPIGRSQPYASPAACGQPIDRVLTALSFVRGIYSDSVIRGRLDRGPDVVPGASCSARQLWNGV